MKNFEVGDEVRYIGNDTIEWNGAVGVVIKGNYDTGIIRCDVKLNDYREIDDKNVITPFVENLELINNLGIRSKRVD